MKKMSRIAITTVLSLFFGAASLAAAENTLSEKVPVYSLQEVVCRAERTPSEPEIAVVIPDMVDIHIAMATDNMLGLLDEKEVYVLPEVVCIGERIPSVDEITAGFSNVDDIGIVTAKENILASLREEAYMLSESIYSADAFSVQPRRTPRVVAGMRAPDAHRMKFQRQTAMSFPL